MEQCRYYLECLSITGKFSDSYIYRSIDPSTTVQFLLADIIAE